MSFGQQNLIYNFDSFVDLTDKANSIIAKLDKLESTAMIFNKIVKNELQTNKGKFINNAVKELDRQTENQINFYNDSKITMRKMATYYTEIVNDMNSQRMTLYYDIIEMNR